MKWSVVAAGLGAVFIFLFAGYLLQRIPVSQNPNVWKEASSSLFDLTFAIDQVIQKEGTRPDEKRVNGIIQKVFQAEAVDTPFLEEEDPDHLLYFLAEKIADEPSLHPWGKPPVYAERNDLPNGFGFYLKGEDGVSNSKGEDEDDLNTWGYHREEFYKKRDSQRRMLKLSGLSLIPSLLGFVFLLRVLRAEELRSRILKVVKPLVLFVGIPIGVLMTLLIGGVYLLFGFPSSNSGWFYPTWKSKLPGAATEVYEQGRGEVFPGDYSYIMRAKVTREEFLAFCNELEMTPHSEKRRYEDSLYEMSWRGYHPGCGGWWVPTDSLDGTHVWQKGHTWEYAKYEGGYLYFSSFKH